MDFLVMREVSKAKNGKYIKLEPTFNFGDSQDIIIKGGKVYAIYDESKKLWVTNDNYFPTILDKELKKIYKDYEKELERKAANDSLSRTYLENDFRFDKFGNSSSGYLRNFNKFAKEIENVNSEIDINTKVIFKNMELEREDYCANKLDYAIEEGSTESWDALIDVLYEPIEKEKIEWLMGSIISGYSQVMQKFFMFYGAPGTGKSTVLDIFEDMFQGYCAPFNAKRLVSSSEFALDSLSTNPLIAIQHDGNISRVEDNTLLNSVVSHETMMVNTKFKIPYKMKFRSVLILCSNSPVQITDSKSGIKRRLIDIWPTGDTVPKELYNKLNKAIRKYERGAIAYKCLQTFNRLGENYYDKYESVVMSYKTDVFMNFVESCYDIFKTKDMTTLDEAWKLYKMYLEDSGDKVTFNKTQVRENLKDYFYEYYPEYQLDENSDKLTRHVYMVFKKEQFKKLKNVNTKKKRKEIVDPENWLEFNCTPENNSSNLDLFLQDYKAQYATGDGIPGKRWENVKTKLKDIDTTRLHYVQGPEMLITLDFDKKNEKGEKDFKLNYELAKQFPKTYAELSKSGAGIHLEYFYTGDVGDLNKIFDQDVEIKIFTGNASLRRQLTKFNDLPIAKISDGLPLKEKKGDKMLDQDVVATEQGLRKTIVRCLRNEIHGHHKPNMDFMLKILSDAFNNGVKYDVSDMYNDILSYAMESSNRADYCLEVLSKLPLKSDEPSEANVGYSEDQIVFFDVEIWPNLFIFGFKFRGGEKHVLLNPKPEDIEPILQYKLIGFNNRRYDNHIVYAYVYGGYSIQQLFNLSQKIIKAKKGEKDSGLFPSAYELSYADIYDFCKTKQSLKKWEIELGISHKEMDTDWDKPLPEEKWAEAAEYNGNDLVATEMVFESKKVQVDFTSRLILADIANGTVMDTDNMLTEKLILGGNYKDRKNARNSFYYRNLAEPVTYLAPDQKEFLDDIFPEMMAQPHGDAKSLLPYFPGYTFDKFTKTSIYKGEEIGEGGLVRATPGVYGFSKTYDVASMHPHSLAAEYYFGKYTPGYYDLVKARIAIKHDDMEVLSKLFDGKLQKYLVDDEIKSQLSTALKTPINAVYGLTAASFENNLRHPDNIDNIVAKRGALFMMDLRDAVIERGYKIFHIKTDSLKVLNPDEYIETFIMEFGKRYGYSFEVEHEFEKICLVNDAVYIAKVTENDSSWKKACKKAAEKNQPMPTRWTATGTQFAIPYVFKTLFSKEPITFDDVCTVKNVSKGSLYLDFNEGLPDVSKYELIKDILNDVSTGNDKWTFCGYSGNKYTKRDIAMANEFFESHSIEELDALIAEGHSRQFIGRVGNFCPIIAGYGGAELVCLNEQGKYVAPSGTKDIRWMEASYVKEHGLEDKIDYEYFNAMVNEAIKDINEYDPSFLE